jgi:AAA ATPase domain
VRSKPTNRAADHFVAASSNRGLSRPYANCSLADCRPPGLVVPAASLGLRGRRTECRALDRLLAHARDEHSGVVVVRGEAEVGKTALLDYLAAGAHGFRIVRAIGIESEMELAYAGLHQLCATLLDGLEGLPAPQRDALSTAFGISAGEPPDRFLVGLAVLSLVSEVAEGRPLLAIVDDAQWLDRVSAQTLGFVARRLLAERIAFAFGLRDPSDEQELHRLPELVVTGLSDSAARALRDSVISAPVDQRPRQRAERARCPGPVSPSACPLSVLPIGVAVGSSGCPPRSCRGDRPGPRSRPPCLASRARRRRPRRGRCRRAGALR